MPQVEAFKLGRQAAIHPIGYRSIASYMDTLTEAPATFDHTNGFNGFQMLGNGPDPTLTVNGGKPVGDCGVVGTVNVGVVDSIITAIANGSDPSTLHQPSSNVVVTEYDKYDRGQDVGVNLTSFLAFYHNVGLPWGGVTLNHEGKLPGYAALNFRDLGEFWAGVNEYGAAYIGIVVTKTMMIQTQLGEPWDLTGQETDDEVIGGHCVTVISRTTDGGEVATWGQRQPFTTRWFQRNVEEAHVLLTNQFIARKGNGLGVDLGKLQSDLVSVSAQAV